MHATDSAFRLPGGRSLNILIFGGTGFVGRHLARALTAGGHQLTIITRHLPRHRDMQLWPRLRLMDCSMACGAQELSQSMAGQDVVINLVGILNERGHDGRGFAAAHVEFTEKILRAAVAVGVRRYLHMSALQADAVRGTSFYLRTKGAAEDFAHEFGGKHGVVVTSFRHR